MVFPFVIIVHIVDVFLWRRLLHFALALANHVSCMSCSVGWFVSIRSFDACIWFFGSAAYAAAAVEVLLTLLCQAYDDSVYTAIIYYFLGES